MNVSFDGAKVHCVAAEPHATFLRIGVSNGRKEVAYEVAVLGRLRRGYRVFLLRGVLGTRIELCYMFVQISFGGERNLWPTYYVADSNRGGLRLQSLHSHPWIGVCIPAVAGLDR